jgi:hypothetical protein
MYFTNNLMKGRNDMKKIVMLVAFSMFAASTAFASGPSITMDADLLATNAKTGLTVYGHKTAATPSTSQIGKTSTGVAVGLLTSIGGYSLVTQHKNGSKAFGSAFDSTSIYSIGVSTKGVPMLPVPQTTGSTDFASWTTQ